MANKVILNFSNLTEKGCRKRRVACYAPVLADSSLLNYIQGGKRMLEGHSPMMRAVFETGLDLELVEISCKGVKKGLAE